MCIKSIPSLLGTTALFLLISSIENGSSQDSGSISLINSTTSNPLFSESQEFDPKRKTNLTKLIDELSHHDVSVGNESYQSATAKWLLNNQYFQQNESNLVQRYVLGTLYFATGGDDWNTTWNLTGSECEWSGITCDEQGSVKEIILGANGLNGIIPPELGFLLNLEVLEFWMNNLHGTIPTELSSLSSLQFLGLDRNTITGSIPSELGLLSSLTKLWLNENTITSTIPSELGSLSSLQKLWLNENTITGPIPSELGSLPSLTELRLENNYLSGTTPYEIGDINNVNLQGNEGLINTRFSLRRFFMLTNGNQWKNKDGWFSKKGFSKCYDFESNSFCYYEWVTGHNSCDENKEYIYNNCTYHDERDSDWECNFYGISCNKNETSTINLPNNYLEGSIPTEIAFLEHLEVLHLDGNRLKGSIPLELGNLDSLQNLGLSHNLLEGTIPQGVKDLLSGNLSTLKIQNNHIEDSLSIEEHKGIEVIADCGKTLTSDPLISCSGCSICCRKKDVNLECIKMETTFPLSTSVLSTNTKLPFYSLFALFVILLTVVLCMFLSLFFLMVMGNKVKLVSSKVIQSFQEESVYKFLLSKNKAAMTIALFTMLVQLFILYVFIIAADYTSNMSDWVYAEECPPGIECQTLKRMEWYIWILFVIIVGVFLIVDILEGLKIMLVGFNDKDWRNFFAGFAVLSVSVISFVSSWLYNWATALSSIDILMNSVVILFLNDIDEQMYRTVNHLFPDWVQKVEAAEIQIDATREMSESLQRTISSQKTIREEDNQRFSRLETSVAKIDTQVVEMVQLTSNNRISELEKCNKDLKESNKQLKKEMEQVKYKLNQLLSNRSNDELQILHNRVSELEKSNKKFNQSNNKLDQKMNKMENIFVKLLENKNRIIKANSIICELEKSDEEIKRFNEELKIEMKELKRIVDQLVRI